MKWQKSPHDVCFVGEYVVVAAGLDWDKHNYEKLHLHIFRHFFWCHSIKKNTTKLANLQIKYYHLHVKSITTSKDKSRKLNKWSKMIFLPPGTMKGLNEKTHKSNLWKCHVWSQILTAISVSCVFQLINLCVDFKRWMHHFRM